MAWDAAHGKPIQSREERVNIIAFLRQQGLDVEVKAHLNDALNVIWAKMVRAM
jgi:hypothetical protein